MKNRFSRALWPLLLSWLALAIPQAHAQSNDDDEDDEDEVFTLSPFEVNTEKDSGYYATSTLAGSRINTELKDVASSISVVTKQFMDDIASNDASTLLNYTTGTEVSGVQGNFLGIRATGTNFADSDGLTRTPNLTNRVRGLSGADQTRDFFLSIIPWDSYNVDRVEINRGSNSFLFGLGSAAGIINTNTIRPIMNERRTEIELVGGRFGTKRAVLDHNQPVIDDVLTVRVALKAGDKRYMQSQAYQKDERGFIAVDFRPFKYTRIRGNVETGSIDSNRPDTRPPLDFISGWIDMGKPVFDSPTNSFINQGPVAPGALDLTQLDRDAIFQNVVHEFWVGMPYFSDNPHTWDASLWGFEGKGAFYNENWQNNGGGEWPKVQPTFKVLRTPYEYLRLQHADKIAANNYTTPTMTDPNIFDFYENLLSGPNKWEVQEFDAKNISIEQTIPVIDVILEASFDQQEHNISFNNTWNNVGAGIYPDINSHLIDGRPNPHVNRPFLYSAGWAQSTDTSHETLRLTAYKEFDLEEMLDVGLLGRLLGRHALTANWQEYETRQTSLAGRPHVAGPEIWFANPSFSGERDKRIMTRRALNFFTYVGDPMTGAPADANISAPRFSFFHDEPTIPVLFHNVVDQEFQSIDVDVLKSRAGDMSDIASPWGFNRSREEIRSSSIVLQSNILDDAVVSTMGWRTDEYKSYRAPNAIQDGFVYIHPPIDPEPTLVQEESSFAYGIVARLPRPWRHLSPFGLDLSVFYNQSDNFAPEPPRQDIFRNSIDPPKGETEEYGFMVNTQDSTFSLRTTFYETAATGSTLDNRRINNEISRFLGFAIDAVARGWNDDNPAKPAFVNWLKSEDSAYIRNAFDFDIEYGEDGDPVSVTFDEGNGVIFDTQDAVSKGYEVELVYNPLPNWRLALNFSNQEAVTSNSSRASLRFLPMLQRDFNGEPGKIWISQGSNPLSQRLINFENTILRQVAQDGFPNIEVRENRLNLITNYWFPKGPLKGISIGGAVRWQDEVVLGTGYRDDPKLGVIPDLNNLYYGPEETNVDAWISYGRPILNGKVDWKIQLNVRNIGVGKELIPVGTQPDGTVVVTRIAPPMTWTIKNTFSF